MKIDKYIQPPIGSGSAHQVETAYEAERLTALGIKVAPYCGYESPVMEKIRHEHQIRNVQEKKRKDEGA
jgi:hypothetical protein